MRIGDRRRDGRRRRAGLAAVATAAALLAALPGCTKRAEADAGATLEAYRRTSGAKPLGAAQLIRLRLLAPAGAPAQASGSGEVVWEQDKYRESLSSQGLFTVRGIQSAKAYFTDEDGVTRVVSEPVLRELTTRAYFWRRAWLFADRGGARISPGPAAPGTESVVLSVWGGNALTLVFSEDKTRLIEARSPRMHLQFSAPNRYRDLSDRRHPFEAEITWTGLPTSPLPDATVGGGSARFSASTGSPFSKEPRGVLLESLVGGLRVPVRVDAAAGRLLRVSPALGSRLKLTFRPDAFGRRVADGVTLAAGGVTFGALHAELGEELRGEEAEAGAPFFRETVVEIDPSESRVRFHDAETWVPPENLVRVQIDDDQNRPAAILTRGSETLRLLFPTAIDPEILLSPVSAERVGLPASGRADGLRWGPIRLEPLPYRTVPDTFDVEWGEEGALGWPPLLAYHAYIHMPRRWLYLGAPGSAAAPPPRPNATPTSRQQPLTRS